MFRIFPVAVACLSFVAAHVLAQESAAESKTVESLPQNAAKSGVSTEDQNAATDGASDSPKAEQLEQWIKDLVDPKFAVRQIASQKLVEAGSAGMEAVAKAAESRDLEHVTRCLAVLTEGLGSTNEAVRKSARNALEKLTKSENKSVAQRAQQALDAPMGSLPGAVVPAPGRRAGNLGGVNNVAVRIQVNNQKNGAREIKISENGKEVVIKDLNRKDITVTITETINGMKKVTAGAGKDADDLKKNSPEAFAYYDRYANGVNGNGIQLRIGGNPGVFLPPAGPRPPRLINPLKAAQLFEEIEKQRQRIDDANERLNKAVTAEKPSVEELKLISEEIKSATKRLSEIKKESEVP